MQRHTFLIFMLTAACEAPKPLPVTVPVASTILPTASFPETPDAAVCVADVSPVAKEETDLRTQSYKSMCDVLTRTCAGSGGDPECAGFYAAYFTSLKNTRGPFTTIHMNPPWIPPEGWMTRLSTWQVFCLAKSRTAQEVRSCNTTITCLDFGPRRLK